MDHLFDRERELCCLFARNRKNEKVSIDYVISNKSVEIYVTYEDKADWDIESGKIDLNRLWKNFNLPFIGYKSECVTLTYTNMNDYHVTEYVFTMIFFNIDSFYSDEFKNYNPNY